MDENSTLSIISELLARLQIAEEKIARMESVFNDKYSGMYAGPVGTEPDPELNAIELLDEKGKPLQIGVAGSALMLTSDGESER